MISAIIIDNNQSVDNLIRKTIEQFFGMVNIVATCSGIPTATQAIINTNPDLVIMDPDLPDGNAFDLLKCLACVNFKLIVATANSNDNAIEAIKHHAIDFWAKPIDETTVIKGMIEACILIETNKLKQPYSHLNTHNKIGCPLILHTNNDVHIVKQNEILYCTSDGSYTQFVLTCGKKLLVSKNLKTVEESLVNAPFFRIHHAYLVNMQHVIKFTRNNGGAVYFTNGAYLPVSVRKKPELLRLLEAMQQ